MRPLSSVHQSISPSEAAQFFSQGSLKLLDADARSNIEAGDVKEDFDGPVLIADPNTGELIFKTMRWGLPHFKNDKDQIANIRNLKSPWWRGKNAHLMIKPEYRCLVPFSSFAEYSVQEKSKVFFAVDAPFPVFAVIWQP